MANIKLRIANFFNLEECEDQIYSNKTGLTTSQIKEKFNVVGSMVKPDIGNFPHMSGENASVVITKVYKEDRDNNTGIDISDILEKLNA